MVIPQIPIISFILENTLQVGTATYTAQGSGIARSLFAGISIVLRQVDNPEQAERITRQLNQIASLSKGRSRIYQDFVRALNEVPMFPEQNAD